MVLENMEQSSDAKDEMRQRLETFVNRDTKKINMDDEDQKLFDEITTQLDKKDEWQGQKLSAFNLHLNVRFQYKADISPELFY